MKNETTCTEREKPKYMKTQIYEEETTLEVNPLASDTPADTMWIRDILAS